MPLRLEYLPATGAAQQHLVLLHGWGCTRDVWRPLLTALRPWADITLLDLPGCAPGGTASDTAPGLQEVLSDILEVAPDRAVYVGWSLGGQLAIELAAQAPERVQALVTICTNPAFVALDDWPGMDAELFQAFREEVAANPGAALKRFDALQVLGSAHPRQRLRELRRHMRGDATGDLLAGLGWLEALDLRETLSILRQPRLHLLAERDALVPAHVAPLIAAGMTHASSSSVKQIPHASHLALLDAPAALVRDIYSFLDASKLLHTGAIPAAAPEKKDVANSFSRAAATYDAVARLQREVGEQLLILLDERLDQAQCVPTVVLDLGCGTGFFHRALRTRFPAAQYIGLDIAPGMVRYAREHHPGDSAWLVADAEALPLAGASVDLVFSSLALQWCYRPDHLFAELARILRPGGRCVFTSLGPATLCELRDAWAAVDTHQHVNTFLAVPTLRDAARSAPGLTLDLKPRPLVLDYVRVRELLDELKTLGAHNMNRHRPAGLTGRRALQGMLAAYESLRADGMLPATYDVIYGFAEKS